MSDRILGLESDRFLEGMPVYNRMFTTGGSAALGNGFISLTFFTPERTQLVSSMACFTGTAAGATPTLGKFGLYEVQPDHNLSMIGVTANTPTLFNSTNATSRADLISPVVVKRGHRYAASVLCVTGASLPSVLRCNLSQSAVSTRLPRVAAGVAGTDLPETIPNSTLGAASTIVYFELYRRTVAQGVSTSELLLEDGE